MHDLDDCDNIYALADKVRLKQCLLNLINNAVKYNIDGGAVNVILQHDERHIDIMVENTGSGIPEDKQSELFQPFNRLGVENSSIEGSGIGLVITKELLEKMQGNITYSQGSLLGACFKVSLPIADVDAVPAQIDFSCPYDPDLFLPFFDSGKNILYVEDNISNICLMKNLLKPYSQLDLVCHDDPFLGLYHARTQHPDIIILDINLSGISGLELVKLLKVDSKTQHIPVIPYRQMRWFMM
ncbi:hypothetical protein AB835_11965 [Candidatus Endobugula sertula]|uniref:histidine kinase n=1 Tax=Candidatus Endobugula sertula TaxID=62101 RepID=A0A1D2QMS1_9GAMM|nr:hypothetical protein AB835_11965 [Candidatus Endobugula sertula]